MAACEAGDDFSEDGDRKMIKMGRWSHGAEVESGKGREEKCTNRAGGQQRMGKMA